MGVYFVRERGFGMPTPRQTNSLFISHAEAIIIVSWSCHFLNYQSIA